MRNLCLLLTISLAGTACAAGTRVDPKAPQGAIGGRIDFPAGVAPPMRICAVSPNTAPHCIDSPKGRTLYRIGELPDGEYQVIARVQSPDMPVAGVVQKVQCFAAPCLDPLAPQHVAGGRELAAAHLNGFYAKRADFPEFPDAASMAEAAKQ